ncbi:Uu.00g079970.m01.CDS01 [Anthostomella pinea]|uniref:ATP-dependent DNA helicase PIF1 n=1 Tax=Anthostomella pinea TaxID=933095 RepID=A0AAI8YJ59_9PEZI|nr:Uu.00g079970.m01.CDS01 [Anthostomella pinea]
MNAGAIRTRILISSPFFRALPRRLVSRQTHSHACARPGVNAFTFGRISTTPDAMLGRARDRAQASGPRSAAPSSSVKPELAKQLFPSSSPHTHDGNIASWASSSQKPRPTVGANASARPPSFKPAAHDPLVSRSNNSQSRANSLASICSNAGSFQEELGTSSRPSQPYPPSSVYIADDDFSDDNTLELDYECPASLPPPPPPPAPKPAATLTSAPTTSQIPWSSSPQGHMFPPALPRKNILKRFLPEEAPPPGPPAAKKRSLPRRWAQRDTDALGDDDVQEIWATQAPKPLATPAPKKQTALPWDTTQSATKERRKQLKNQSKKSGVEPGFSTEEMREVTDEHVLQKTKASAISLSSEQQHVIDLVVRQKQSVFFTGPAGTGKSVLMRAIIAELKKKWARDPERLSVTASTGLAACNIGGQTLHSFSGIGLGKEDVPTLVKKIRKNAKAKNRWLRTNTLVIDEVSMVDGDLFDKLSQIARTIRNNGRPFGGIQLVITGDFFQLPPVPDGGKKEAKFAFDAATWNTSIDHTIGLTQVFRQKDPHFAGILNEMRLGRISDDTVQTFKDLSRPLGFDDGLSYTELFPTRQEVERSNESRLRSLDGPLVHYEAHDSGDPSLRDRLLANMMAPKGLALKKGAQVMLIKNMDETLVNGSLGKVIGFMNEMTFELWSTNGAGEGLDSGDEGEADAGSKKKIKAFSRDTDGSKDMKEYPIVRFTSTDGSHRVLLCIPEDWKVELPTGEVQASRKQLPLILAWALSIHKAQGQTLERVKVDLGKVFEKGQAYVALSRAVSKQGLQVLRFEKSKVMAHPRVIQFYNKLYSAESAVKTKKSPSMADFAYKGTSTKASKTTGYSSTSRSTGRRNVDVIDLDEEEAAMAAYG